jgi:hypothetical protein
MTEPVSFVVGTAAGYAFGVWAWPALRARVVRVEAELRRLKTRAAELEAKLTAMTQGLRG